MRAPVSRSRPRPPVGLPSSQRSCGGSVPGLEGEGAFDVADRDASLTVSGAHLALARTGVELEPADLAARQRGWP
jgi:hypothetical protein